MGRKDDIIKSFGYRVSPYEIERVYKSHPDVADCAAIGEEIEKDKLLVVAYILPREGSEPDPNDLLEIWSSKLSCLQST
jgi:acetyl-CoA synthetase